MCKSFPGAFEVSQVQGWGPLWYYWRGEREVGSAGKYSFFTFQSGVEIEPLVLFPFFLAPFIALQIGNFPRHAL